MTAKNIAIILLTVLPILIIVLIYPIKVYGLVFGAREILIVSVAWVILIPTALGFNPSPILEKLKKRFEPRPKEAPADKALRDVIDLMKLRNMRRILMIGIDPFLAETSPVDEKSRLLRSLRCSEIEFHPVPKQNEKLESCQGFVLEDGITQEANRSNRPKPSANPTRGRYQVSVISTTWDYAGAKDSHRCEDEWNTFLETLLVSRHRYGKSSTPSHREILKTGAFFDSIILVADLRKFTAENREKNLRKAAQVRQQILELRRKLRLRVPVYLVFTRCESIPGFQSLFEKQSDPDRKQTKSLVWGFARNKKEIQFGIFFEQEGNTLYDSLLTWIYDVTAGDSQMAYYLLSSRFRHYWQEVKRFAEVLFSNEEEISNLIDENKQETAEAPIFRGLFFTAYQEETRKTWFTRQLFLDIFTDQLWVRPTRQGIDEYQAYRKRQKRVMVTWAAGLSLLLIAIVVVLLRMG